MHCVGVGMCMCMGVGVGGRLLSRLQNDSTFDGCDARRRWCGEAARTVDGCEEQLEQDQPDVRRGAAHAEGRKERSVPEMGSDEMGSDEMGSDEIGSDEMGSDEMGADEMGADEMGGGSR
jgi:pentapeptide MXKDX repeat protein